MASSRREQPALAGDPLGTHAHVQSSPAIRNG
jgi:hypothetical protein